MSQTESSKHWYVLKTQTKREAVAAGSIRERCQLNVFCPRITYTKKTRTGKRRFTEALFPSYIFVYFDLLEHQRHINSLPGVRGIVKFNNYIPQLPASIIEELQQNLDKDDECFECKQDSFAPGSDVFVTEGPFKDFIAKVCSTQNGTERINILFEFLGQTITISLEKDKLLPAERPDHPYHKP